MILNSEHRLADLLGTSLPALRSLAASVDSMYSPFWDRSGRKPRLIDRPIPTLRAVQRRVYQRLLKDYPYSEFAIGGVRGKSVRHAVECHRARPIVVQVDVREFYPSISDRAVFSVWRRLGHGTKVSSLLTRLTTYKRRIPQGAPTSMALANLYMEPVDRAIFDTLRLAFPDVLYTRWVDDMIFSGQLNAAAVFSVVARNLRDAGLRAHRAREKRRVMPSDSSQQVLGTVVNRRVSLPRHRKRLTRAIVHTAQKFGGNPDSVKGHIQHLRSFHVSLADQLEDSLRLKSVLFARPSGGCRD